MKFSYLLFCFIKQLQLYLGNSVFQKFYFHVCLSYTYTYINWSNNLDSFSNRQAHFITLCVTVCTKHATTTWSNKVLSKQNKSFQVPTYRQFMAVPALKFQSSNTLLQADFQETKIHVRLMQRQHPCPSFFEASSYRIQAPCLPIYNCQR